MTDTDALPRSSTSCSTWNLPDRYDLVVIGAGHAGIEASLAGARQGMRTMLITMSLQSIGQMSCNPAIGGIGKGQLVREIDALGGEMARTADLSGIQFRMLNRSKGAAVWSPRAQADKWQYASLSTHAIFSQPGLVFRQGLVSDLLVRDGLVQAVQLDNGTLIHGAAFILCSGTFLNGITHVGAVSRAGGRAGEPSALGLSQALARNGIEIRRYKTGTPPRIDRSSVDFSCLAEQHGDVTPTPFRYYERLLRSSQISCHIAWTNEGTHQILRDHLHLSPMHAGLIEGIGPRYCPSVEDKVVRFADKDRHQLFLEPESVDSREMYINGFSTSMPEEIQLRALRTIPGFDQARFTRPGYAIEYDYFPAWQIGINMSMSQLPNLFLAGQINGTSGYEEAAAQGLMSAINAAALLDNRDPLVLGRDQAYIGVLIDDLVNKPLSEPYRMFTSRAEFRLLLRQDNADERLMPIARQLGLLEDWRWQELLKRREQRAALDQWLITTNISTHDVMAVLNADVPPPLSIAGQEYPLPALGPGSTHRACEWLKRPELGLAQLLSIAGPDWTKGLEESQVIGVELDYKYAGYIKRQMLAVENFRRNEDLTLPDALDYAALPGLSNEAREHLGRIQPRNMGQAARIGGVKPTDIQAVWVHLQRRRVGSQQEGSERQVPRGTSRS